MTQYPPPQHTPEPYPTPPSPAPWQPAQPQPAHPQPAQPQPAQPQSAEPYPAQSYPAQSYPAQPYPSQSHPSAPEGPAAPAPATSAPATSAPATSAPVTPAPPSPDRRRGPGWIGTGALVLGGMLLSSGLTVGGFAAMNSIDPPSITGPAQASPTDSGSAQATPIATTASPDWSAVAQKVGPSTVAIEARTPGGIAEGTGVIRAKDGTIITNNHVVADAQEPLRVSLADGRILQAEIVGTDASTDLAVIRLQDPPDDLTPATLGDSEAMKVGEPVMALGTPLGLQNTVTTGIISATHRPVTATGEASRDPNDATFTSALQTDAAVNPGNSGGPLVNAAGEVIGINSSIASFPNAQQQAGSIGLGFAIPANTVELIADQLAETGKAQHAMLGVTAGDAEARIGSVTHRGAQVREVSSDSPAATAGVRTDDVIIAVDDIPVDSATALTGVVRGLEVGSEHTVVVLRDGARQEITVTLGSSA